MPDAFLSTDVLIAGGGMAGLTLGCLLGGTGLSVLIAEPKTPPQTVAPGTRTVALFGGSINILKAAGIWDEIAQHSARMETMRIIDDTGSAPVTLSFDASEIGEECFGYNIPHHGLYPALLSRAKALKTVTLLTGSGVQDYQIENGHSLATLTNGQTIRAALIAGADGRHSRVREVAGLPCRLHDYGQRAMTAVIAHTKPHDHISTEFHRPGGPFALVPLPDDKDNHCSSVVWVEREIDAKSLLSLDPKDFERALQERTNDILGAIRLLQGPDSWPLQWSVARKLTAPRVAILAESAHTFTPLGAQGLNLSLRDVATLAETLVDAAKTGADIGSALVLGRYERRRRLDVLTRVGGVNAFNRLVSNDMAATRLMRRMGMKTLDHLPPLKRFAMQRGLISAPDEGRLAKGSML
ncbi:MAG: FAD-dependent monooxygenase [Alphaproteobacteria bacterium]|nr:FAD-dependent monooxygenase [Alphaproteobacteria bacterium]